MVTGTVGTRTPVHQLYTAIQQTVMDRHLLSVYRVWLHAPTVATGMVTRTVIQFLSLELRSNLVTSQLQKRYIATFILY